MRELRFVSSDDDDASIVVETSSSVGVERFRLPVSDELRAAIAPPEQTPPVEQTPPTEAQAPSISPREIQVRVRAGELPETIASMFDASLDWVMRFAGPVIEERGRITDEARRARARRSTADAQSVLFGETVDSRFAGHGIDPAVVEWDSRRREDGQWIVSAHWIGGESERTAQWAFNLTARTVSAIDETASDLLSDRPIRPVFTEAPVTLTTTPPLAPGVVAFPARPNAHTGPLPTREQLFDQHAFGDAPGPVPPPAVETFDAMPLPLDIEFYEPPVTGDVNAPGDVASQDSGYDTVEIDDDLAEVEAAEINDARPTVRIPQVTNLGVAHREPRSSNEDEKSARAHIPSWDDILLGVRRKND